MEIEEYFNALSEQFDKAYETAKMARAMGYDPKETIEITPAPDLASRVEGLIGVRGLADTIRRLAHGQSRSALAFDIVKEICTSEAFAGYDTVSRISLAVKTGTAVNTEGILVAPTEGIQGVEHYRNQDGTDYIAVLYAGPIRGAGGTAAALSVALADHARRIFNIGVYRPTQEEVERYVEETELYHSRCARLQYKPSDEDLRSIVSDCPVCVDGLPTETVELSVHMNMKKISADGKEVPLTNRVRSGIALVLCEGVAQKAKKLAKEVKYAGLGWDWLEKVIHIDKTKKSGEHEKDKKAGAFLEELVAGRPIFSYPGMYGGFRLRYGRTRMTGIASKGFNIATMVMTGGFIAVGTQLKIEFPGKGCVAVPVDSIEGPFVRLRSGEALRVNDYETAVRVNDEVEEFICLGDILCTFGDFRKSNNPLQPTSYVEEFWDLQLAKAAGAKQGIDHGGLTFENAYLLSLKHAVPLHPKFLLEFQAVTKKQVEELALALIRNSELKKSGDGLFNIEGMELAADKNVKRTLELLTVPHKMAMGKAVINKDFAQSLLVSLGFASGQNGALALNELTVDKYAGGENEDALTLVNRVSPIKIMKRSTFVGTRIGRPEKAKERLMKPAPHVLFPLGAGGGKERDIAKAYSLATRKLGSVDLTVEMARYKCENCKRIVNGQYCRDCNRRAELEPKCPVCGAVGDFGKCSRCGVRTLTYETHGMDLVKVGSEALGRVGMHSMPKVVKGVMGMTNRNKMIEPLEKGLIRASHNVFIFKDGTARFDATDVPITHFYPKEIGTSVERLRELGYDSDYRGNALTSDDQLVEMRHQDVILNNRGGEYMLRVSQFVDEMLTKLYKLEPFYNAEVKGDLIGKLLITLSPHTSCGVLNRIIGFTDASVGFAHPYTITSRRRNADGDEDTSMLLLDALINFSREYLPSTIGGTMDAPLILTLHIAPEEADDEVHSMEVVEAYPLEFYEKTYTYSPPSEAKMELVENRLGTKAVFQNLDFTHEISANALAQAPKRSKYTQLKTMAEKVEVQFALMDKFLAIDKPDAARKLIISHFIPDLIGNMHSYSKQIFRCAKCNAKYRRVPLTGKCTRDGNKLLLTISRGGIEKYLSMAITLADRYTLDTYIRQRLKLAKEEIDSLFGEAISASTTEGQFSLSKYM